MSVFSPRPSGSITLFGEDISGKQARTNLAKVRHRTQFIFQDPNGSLNPRMRVRDTVGEPLDIKGGLPRKDRVDRIAELLAMVGLPLAAADRYPHEFSGGQRQRICIARALALHPDFIVCDEPVSALDVSTQAQVANLLLDLQEKFGLSYLFIAHDLAVVRAMSTRIGVMYAGSLVELASRSDLYTAPLHPYTQALMAVIPRPETRRVRRPTLAGEVPSLINRPPGCIFASRCPKVQPLCRETVPRLREIYPGHKAACHLL